jgi:cobalt-zinc-cadmium efflux system outer membrane protein
MFSRILYLTGFLVASSQAQHLELTLANTADEVKRRNPALAAARMTIEEALGRAIGAGRLPNPTVGVEFQNESRLSPRTVGASLDQSFPLTGRLRLERRVSEHEVRLAELEVQEAERRLVADSASLVVKLLALNQQQVLRAKQATLARELSQLAQSRSASGEMSPLDAAQVQVDAQRSLLETRKIETERVALLGELKAKLGVAPAATVRVSGTLPPLALPGERAWRTRPDYQAAQVREQAAVAAVDLARARRWQDASAGFFAAQESMDSPVASRERTGFIGFRFSLPLPLWNRNEGEIREKSAGAEKAALEAEALAVAIANEAATARAEMAAHATLARETTGQLLPLLTEQAERVEKAYREGQADMLSLLQVREQRLQMEAAALDAARDFHLARIRYLAATAAKPKG